MIVPITAQTIAQIKNPRFAAYAAIYLKIQQRFVESVQATGIEFDSHDGREESQARIEQLRNKGARVRNSNKSLYLNRISPSCEACQTGLGSVTFFISLQCHRNCFFCFNPNQENYEYFKTHTRDCVRELDEIRQSGARVEHIALTGGEPLLHKEQTVEFFRAARAHFSHAYTRLYTSGDFADDEILRRLETSVDEIRFSIRMDDPPPARAHTLERIASAKAHVPNVMVEMPVLPGTSAEMKPVLQELDRIGIFGINLLEFAFPLNRAEIFRARGYRIKNPPYRVLYNYGYAGGLPVARSEQECLDLLEFALDADLKMGVHYCSLENKHTGEIYQRHLKRPLPPHLHFSPRDYFLKSAKVFGRDIDRVLPVFNEMGYAEYQRNKEHHYLEFHVSQIPALKDRRVEVGISTAVMETRSDGEYLRELQVDLTTPAEFDLARDV